MKLNRAGNGTKFSADLESRPLSVRSSVARKRKFTEFIKPMLATLTDEPFDHADWIFELKWDGYRAVAEVDGRSVKLYSRNGLSFSELYPKVADALAGLNSHFVLDGEIVVLDENGKPSFQKLQQFSNYPSLKIVYYVFDCLSYQGKDLKDLPLLERKKILRHALVENEVVKYSDHIERAGISFFKKAVKMNLEGVMAKHANSLYDLGRRTGNWLKIKNHNSNEAVIAGYTSPRASRQYFGALILGIFVKGTLKYIGHTGTGFTDSILKDLHRKMQPLVRKRSPFDEKIPVNTSVTWLVPKLVCNVKFTELTNDGLMRHPVFMGLRIDKKAKEVNHVESKMKATRKTPAKVKKATGKTGGKDQINDETLIANGHRVKLTNQNKVYWPDEGFTKGDVVQYYNDISSYILPYLKDRPQSLKRNPDGIKNKGFFHKDAGANAPDWVKHVSIHAESTNRNVEYILCNNKATLIYLNNLGCIEINPWNSRIKKPDNPDYLILDIDPSENNSFDEVIDVTLFVKDLLDKAGATSYCKTSGATGMHIYVPLHGAYTYEQARPFAELVANRCTEQCAIATTERSLKKRKGRIYVDYLQNSKGQTLSSVYSLRPVPGATISTPLQWKEVKHGLTPKAFNIKTIHKRLSKTGDLFQGVLKDRNNLAKCLRNLEKV